MYCSDVVYLVFDEEVGGAYEEVEGGKVEGTRARRDRAG